VYGYIDLGRSQGLPIEEIADRMTRWAAMGAAGVFLDEAGFDFGVTRARQNAAVAAARERKLRVCFNAFQPADVFDPAPIPLNEVGGGNPDGLEPIVSADTAVLLESFAVRHGKPEPRDTLAIRTQAALEARKRYGTQVWAVSTGEEAAAGTTLENSWWIATVFALDAYGWAMPAFSASTSELPWMPRPAAEQMLARAEYLDDISVQNGLWQRTTSAGTILVDPTGGGGVIESRAR
jgi:hypothetical protein